MNVELNLYKITQKLPERLYIFSIANEIDSLDNIEQKLNRIAFSKKGTIFDKDKFLIISYLKPENIEFEEVLFNEVSDNIQERLVYTFLREEIKVLEKLNSALKPEIRARYTIKPYFEMEISKIDREFYAVLDIKHKIFTNKNLWEYYGKNIKNFKKDGLIDKKVYPVDNSNNSTGIIKYVVFPTDKNYAEELEKIKNFKKYSKEEIENYKSQPILIINFRKNKNYSYFSSNLRLVVDSSELDNKDLNLLKKPHFERKKKITEAIKRANLQNVINPVPLNKPIIKFADVKFITINKSEKSAYKDIFTQVKNNGKYLYIIPPKRIPKILKGKTIPVFVISDESVKFVKDDKKPVKYILDSLGYLKNLNKDFPKFIYSNKDYNINFWQDLSQIEAITKQFRELNIDKDVPPLVIIVGSEKYINSGNDYYEKLKRRLFNNGFISQNIIYEHLIGNYSKVNPNKNFEIDNLILQILAKYGMYPYSLNLKTEYDYILGVDVANDLYGNRSVGGGVAVLNKEGIFESLIPIKIKTGGEKVDYKYILEIIADNLDIEGKKILIIRDGLLHPSEVETAYNKSKELNIKKLSLINIVKNHNFNIYDDSEGKKAVILRDDLALLLNHKFEGANCLKISRKYEINDKIEKTPISKDDLELLYNLSHLNFSNLYLRSEALRLPAVIHYSDKFVKTVGKGWEIDNRLLKEGFLYFL